MTERPGERIAWVAAIMALLYFVWNYLVLARQTAALQGTIGGLGAEVSGPTAFVLSHHRWLYPTVFLGAGIGVVAKELWIRDKRLTTCITFLIALVVLWTADYFKTVLFYPLLGMLEKLA